jgi:hypothetical protein
MAFTLEAVVPWGRSYEEYISMFALTDADLKKQILGCGDGPASFNAELTRRNGSVISVDPIYQFSDIEINKRIETTYDLVLEQTRKNKDEFVWKQIKTVEDLGISRLKAMRQFLEDYPNGNDRYIAGELPFLPFNDNLFDLVLCSHFLFLYSEQYSVEFHVQSIKEMSRVASEVRIFPLLELGAKKSRHIGKVLKELSECGYAYAIKQVDYEFQKGGNEMLQIKSPNQSLHLTPPG